MSIKIGTKALMTNPALKPFEALIGKWKTVGSHPYVPDAVLYGRASFEWLENGAFLIFRSEIDDYRFPDGVEILGSDDVAHKFYMLHFDARGVSRKFDVTIDKNKIIWKRDEPSFSQRCILILDNNGDKMVSHGEMSKDGSAWQKDLELTYTRQ